MNTPPSKMKILDYIWVYTSRKEMTWARVWMEIQELFEAIHNRDWCNIKEEVSDVVLFIQIAIWWKTTINGHIWLLGRASAEKFAARHAVWKRLYVAAGLREDTAGCMANYNKVEKVVKQLTELGVSRYKAYCAYSRVVQPILIPVDAFN